MDTTHRQISVSQLPLDTHFPLVHNLCILSRQAKTVHTIPPSLPWADSTDLQQLRDRQLLQLPVPGYGTAYRHISEILTYCTVGSGGH